MSRFLLRILFLVVLLVPGGALGGALWMYFLGLASRGGLAGALAALVCTVAVPWVLLRGGWKVAGRLTSSTLARWESVKPRRLLVSRAARLGVEAHDQAEKSPTAPPPEDVAKQMSARVARLVQVAFFGALLVIGLPGILNNFQMPRGSWWVFDLVFMLPGVVGMLVMLGLAWALFGALARWLMVPRSLGNGRWRAAAKAHRPDSAGRCPRCPDQALERQEGALHEDVCHRCAGRFLPTDAAQTLLTDHLGLSPAMLKELATHFAGSRLSCPSCLALMSPVTLKGVNADLCSHCGGLWLDRGELERLGGGRFPELGSVTAAP